VCIDVSIGCLCFFKGRTFGSDVWMATVWCVWVEVGVDGWVSVSICVCIGCLFILKGRMFDSDIPMATVWCEWWRVWGECLRSDVLIATVRCVRCVVGAWEGGVWGG